MEWKFEAVAEQGLQAIDMDEMKVKERNTPT